MFSARTTPGIGEPRIEKAVLRRGVSQFDLPSPQQRRAIVAGINGSRAWRKTETMIALRYCPGIRINCVPAKRPSKGVDGLFCPGTEFAGAVADFPLQVFGRESNQPFMRKSMVTDRMTAGSQLRNLARTHWLPVFPFFIAGLRVWVNPRAIESKCIAGRTLGKGRHDKKHSASAKRFKQRRGDSVIALPAIVESKKDGGLGI